MEALDPNDYILSQQGIDWKQTLAPWQHLLPDTFTIWMVNRFGDLFMVYQDGSLHHLDIQLGTITRRGSSKKEFLQAMTEGGNARDWLYLEHVDQAEQAGLHLQQAECYAYKLPPVLSGSYTTDNVCTTNITEHYAFMAGVHQQVKDLPDGTTVELKTPE